MHPGTSAGSDHGFFRRRVCGLFFVQASWDWSTRMSGASILRKVRESIDVKRQFFEENAARIDDVCRLMAGRFLLGHKLFVMGNGGSACDALHVAVEFKHPIIEKRRALPAEALMADIATVSAISNDVDFSRIFVQQLRLLAQPDDMALAISTSGKSPNLIYAIEAARDRGLMTIAFCGKDGGRFPDIAEHCFIVPSFSIHRIQEVHAALIHVLWDMIHVAIGEEDVI
jgi:D-sedoheptulose 7-phosphate isomerase